MILTTKMSLGDTNDKGELLLTDNSYSCRCALTRLGKSLFLGVSMVMLAVLNGNKNI